jgi:hypothetical protein
MSKCECKKCIHNEVCKYEVVHSTKGCEHYKDKSLFVEVVRCKDCEHWKDTSLDTVTEKHWGECRKPLGDYRYCETSENDYCSYAERKLREVGE